MSNVAVSAVMPVFNVAPYVGAAVQSVLNQSFRDFELIVVDDGSSDDSLNICSRLAEVDSRMSVVTHGENRGLGAARNTGLKRAQGTFICFLDGDDLITPDALETLHHFAVDSRADFVHCGSFYKRFETARGVFADARLRICDRSAGVGRLPVDKNVRLKRFFCMNGAKFMPWLNFFRRDFFVKNNLRFLNVLFGDVAFFVAALALADNVFAIRNGLYVYSKRNGSLTNSRHAREAFKKKVAHSIETGLCFLDKTLANVPEELLSAEIKADCKNIFVSTLKVYGNIL